MIKHSPTNSHHQTQPFITQPLIFSHLPTSFLTRIHRYELKLLEREEDQLVNQINANYDSIPGMIKPLSYPSLTMRYLPFP